MALLVAGPSFINAAGTHSISVVFSSVRVNFRVRVRGIIGADNKKLMLVCVAARQNVLLWVGLV